MINSRLLTPEWTVRINGREFTEMQRLAVSEISFEEKLNYTSKLEVVMEDHEGFSLTMNDLPQEGEMSLSLGWDGQSEEIFNGEFTEITPSFEQGRTSTLAIIGYDRSYQLKKKRWPPEAYDKRKLTDVVKAVLEKYRGGDFNLEYVLDPDARIKDYALTDAETGFRPDDQTDWEFLDEKSEDNGMMLLVRGRTIYFVGRRYFQRPQFTARTMIVSPQLNFNYGALSDEENDPRGVLLYHFRPRNRSLQQRGKVEVVSWNSVDANGKKRGYDVLPLLRGEKNYTQLLVKTKNVEEIVVTGAAQSDSAARTMAQAEMEKRARKFVEGNGSLKGWPYVRLGKEHNFVLNALGDIGRSFSGMYFITGTEHRWTRSEGYRTSIDVERRALTE